MSGVNLVWAFVIALGGNAGLWGAFAGALRFFERKRERKEKSAHEESRRWYNESKKYYATAKSEASQAKKDAAQAVEACDKCIEELSDTRSTIFRLLEDFEEQVLPMLMFPDVDRTEVRKQARAAVERARDRLRKSHREGTP